MPSVYKPYPALRVQLRTAGFHAHAQLPLCKNKIQLLHIFQIDPDRFGAVCNHGRQRVQNHFFFVFFYSQSFQFLPKTGYRGGLDKNRSSCRGSVDYGSRNLIFMLLFHGHRIMPVPVGNKALAENASRASEHVLQLQTDLILQLFHMPTDSMQGSACIIIHPSYPDTALNLFLQRGKILDSRSISRNAGRDVPTFAKITGQPHAKYRKLPDLIQLPRTEQASQFCLLCYFTHFLRAAGRRCAKRIQHLPGFRRFLYSRLRPFLIQNGHQSVDPLPGTLRGCSFLQQLTDFVKFQHPIDIVHFSYSLPQINEKESRLRDSPGNQRLPARRVA